MQKNDMNKTMNPTGQEISIRLNLLYNMFVSKHHERIENQMEGEISEDYGRYELVIINKSKYSLRGDWKLYFNFKSQIKKILTAKIDITHINGDFFYLAPNKSFDEIKCGEELRIEFESSNPAFNKSDFPEGFYFTLIDEANKQNFPLEVIEDVKIEKINTGLEIETAEERYLRNSKLTMLDIEEICKITPSPKKLLKGDGKVKVSASSKIYYEDGLKKEAQFLNNCFSKIIGISLNIMNSIPKSSNSMYLKKNNFGNNENFIDKRDEAYRLIIDSKTGIEIVGADEVGVFYGILSLISLFPLESIGERVEEFFLEEVNILDFPELNYRGLSLDVARNFQSKETILKLLDIMALYKLNRFHIHLTDDEGWRLEIKELPELTNYGAFRGHSNDEKKYLTPSYGSGPIADRNISYGCGYYSREDFIEILQYADERKIKIIPEFDFPGHARAAIKSMNARYEKFKSLGKIQKAEEFLLVDPNDKSVYRSVQGWNDNVVDVSLESSYNFIEKVIKELRSITDDSSVDIETIHIGGDEVPKGVWEKSSNSLSGDNDNTDNSRFEKMNYFINRVIDISNKYGFQIGGWEEIVLKQVNVDRKKTKLPNLDLLDKNLKIYPWFDLSYNRNNAYELANNGFDVILCNGSNLYFDLAYSYDPNEIGQTWAGTINTLDVWGFMPFDIHDNLSTYLNQTDKREIINSITNLNEIGKNYILGIQCNLWSENIKGKNDLENLLFPRLLAFAERAWNTEPDITNKNELNVNNLWNEFSNRLGQHSLEFMQKFIGDINYRIPIPGGVIKDNILHANIEFPGLVIRYSENGNEPTKNSPIYKEPFEVIGNIKLRTFDRNGKGSRVVEILK